MGTHAITLLAENELQHSWLLLLGVVLITAALLMGIRKKRRRATQVGTPREQLERIKQEAGVRGDLEKLMVEIEQLAKRLGAQLDAKTIALEKLLREADRTIAKLENMNHTGGNAAAPPATNGAADPKAPSVYQLADEGLSPVEIAQKLDEHVGKIELILALRET